MQDKKKKKIHLCDLLCDHVCGETCGCLACCPCGFCIVAFLVIFVVVFVVVIVVVFEYYLLKVFYYGHQLEVSIPHNLKVVLGDRRTHTHIRTL